MLKKKIRPAATGQNKNNQRRNYSTEAQSYPSCARCWIPIPNNPVIRFVDTRQVHMCRECDRMLDHAQGVELERLHQRVECFFKMGVSK